VTPFSQLAPVGRGAFLTAALLLCFAALYALIYAAALRPGARRVGLCAALFAAACLLQQWAYDIAWRAEAHIPLRPPGQIPAAALWLMLAALSGLTALLLARLYRLRRTRLSPMSIKEGIEHLPTGLCFCEEDGLVLLTNRRMHDLCHAITGGALLDAAAFWEALSSGGQGGASAIKRDPSPMWMLADGSVVSFARSQLALKNRRIFQITAADITGQYRLHTRLQEENRRLQDMNARLHRYGETVREVTRAGEVLAAKVHLHDELGRILLAARRAMRPSAPHDDRAALLGNWRRSLALLRPEAHAGPRATGFERLTEAAEAIGVSVHVRGALPAAGTRAARLMESALRECLTNTVRHAEGTELYADICEGALWTMTLTNNGRIPGGPIVEGSGLNSLRANIEHAGGTMRAAHAPRFALTITVPKESEGFV
jgi:hypothetical protein